MSQVLSPELSERVEQLSNEALVLVLDAYREGRRLGASQLGEQVEALCQRILDEMEAQYDSLTPELVERIEASFEAASPSPVVAASFGMASEAVTRIQQEIARLARARLQSNGR